MASLKKRFQVELSGAEALVRIDWLVRFDESKPAFADQAEQRVLWDIEAMLEKLLVAPLIANYKELLAQARAVVRMSSSSAPVSTSCPSGSEAARPEPVPLLAVYCIISLSG